MIGLFVPGDKIVQESNKNGLKEIKIERGFKRGRHVPLKNDFFRLLFHIIRNGIEQFVQKMFIVRKEKESKENLKNNT